MIIRINILIILSFFPKLISLDIGQLRIEICGLEEVERQLFLEIHYMKNMQERQKWAETFQGKYFNVLGHIFSVYCVWKIAIVSIKICRKK